MGSDHEKSVTDRNPVGSDDGPLQEYVKKVVYLIQIIALYLLNKPVYCRIIIVCGGSIFVDFVGYH